MYDVTKIQFSFERFVLDSNLSNDRDLTIIENPLYRVRWSPF